MRTTPAVLLSLLVAVPGLSVTGLSATGLSATGLSATGLAAASAAVSPAAGSALRGALVPSLSIGSPRPVATSVHELRLAGVDAAALAALREQQQRAGRGAPGASAGLATPTPAVLTRPRLTRGFQTLGVTWADTGRVAADLLITVRSRTAAGWSAWAELDRSDDDPAAGERAGTDPLWVGRSDGVQARVVVRSGRLPRDLRLVLVDPGSSPYDATAVAAPARAAGIVDGVGTAGVAPFGTATVGEPAILTRAQWGADESKVRSAPSYSPTIKAAVLHHTAGPNDYPADAVPAIIRGDYAYHLKRGWNDIGYNALVDRFGRIWEGRAGGLDQAVMGAHAGGFNRDTFGVSMIGNYDVARPAAVAVAAVARVIAWKLDANHRNPFGTARLTSAGGGTARWPAGTPRILPVIMGHRDAGQTACPGRYLYPLLPSIRARVAAIMKAALMNPSGPPATAGPGVPVTVTARSLVAQRWQLDVTGPCAGGRVARVAGRAGAGQEITATWDGRLADGSLARPGRYGLTLTAWAGTAIARPVTGQVLVLPPTPPAEPAGPPSAGPGRFVPVPPARLVDTRTGTGTGIGPGGRLDVPVLGRAGVPATGVSGVLLNLTASCASDATSLTAWPTGTPSRRPVTAVPAGLTRSVLVSVRVGAGGAVSIGNARGVSELAADVVGYYATGGSGGAVLPIASTRIYRSSTDPAGKLTADKPRSIPLPASLGGVPASRIAAVVVDVAAVAPTGAGTLSAYRPGESSTLPTLAYRSGESIDNLAVVPVAGRSLTLAAAGTPVDAVLDVRAVVLVAGAAGPDFTPTKPVLVYDSQAGGGAGLSAGDPLPVTVTGPGTGAPAAATGVLLNLTALAPTATTSLQVYPAGQASTGGAALRLAAGDTRSNLVLVPVGTGGVVMVATARGTAQMRVDVVGYLR